MVHLEVHSSVPVIIIVKEIEMHRRYLTICFAIVLAAAFLSGCATEDKKPDLVYFEVDMILPTVGTSGLMPSEINDILREVETRNREVEDDPDWIKKSYEGLMVRRLNNVSEREYARFEKYLDNGSVYILVHPGFFSFFHYPRRLRSSVDEAVSEYNIVELLLKRRPKTAEFALLQAQERRTRDFFEFKTAQKKLIIFIIPQNYQEYSGYTYRKSRDEYMRYLNEITNFSESVLFIDSRSPNRGSISEADAMRLVEFLLSVNAKNVYVGGSYVGRCLEDFYALLTREYGSEGIYVVPELSDISPREINGAIATELLKPDGSIDKIVAKRQMQMDVYNIQETIPQLINLP
ncbi:hypothetical protein LCGC14_1585860 [marine sediment metagenome]|uniref:Uncharacterized protein n=1 Tax=marine sediment metagenome TaxID=412755 RepID=A0A0F9J1K5_9ZZZZ